MKLIIIAALFAFASADTDLCDSCKSIVQRFTDSGKMEKLTNVVSSICEAFPPPLNSVCTLAAVGKVASTSKDPTHLCTQVFGFCPGAESNGLLEADTYDDGFDDTLATFPCQICLLGSENLQNFVHSKAVIDSIGNFINFLCAKTADEDTCDFFGPDVVELLFRFLARSVEEKRFCGHRITKACVKPPTPPPKYE